MQEKDIDDIVEKHGWFAANIADAEPPFLFSIGLMKTFDHPELIVFGLEKESSYALMSSLIDHLRQGRTFNENGKYTVTVGDDQHEIALRQVHSTQHPLHLGFAMGYCPLQSDPPPRTHPPGRRSRQTPPPPDELDRREGSLIFASRYSLVDNQTAPGLTWVPFFCCESFMKVDRTVINGRQLDR